MISRMPASSLRIAAALLAVGIMVAPRAHADTIGGGALVQNSGLVSGTQSSVYSVNVNGPGVLTVQLENISWPERLAHLDCSIYSNSGFLHALQGTAEWQFVTTGPGSFYASVFAGAGGLLDIGLFSIKVTFQPSAALVPLPAGVWLLGSVLGLFGVRRAWPAVRFVIGEDRFA
jgi:hypothetical protein